MRAAALLGLRATVAVAFLATAALAVTLSRGAPTDAALTSANTGGSQQAAALRPGAATGPGTPRCAPSRLRISLGPGARVPTGAVRYALDFTNVSAAPCTLAGYPQVEAYRGDSALVGDAAAHAPSAVAVRVLLAPGQTAHAALDAAPVARCRPARAAGVRVVVPPGRSGARYVRHSLTACADRAARGQAYLRVHVIQPGPGPA